MNAWMEAVDGADDLVVVVVVLLIAAALTVCALSGVLTRH